MASVHDLVLGCRFTSADKYYQVWDPPFHLAICENRWGPFVSRTQYEVFMLILRCLFLVHGDMWFCVVCGETFLMKLTLPQTGLEIFGTALPWSRICWLVQPGYVACWYVTRACDSIQVLTDTGFGSVTTHMCVWWWNTGWIALLLKHDGLRRVCL